MKNINKTLNLLVAIAIFCLASCKKDTDEFVPYTESDFSDTTWTNTSISDTKSKAIVNALSSPASTNNFGATNSLAVDISSSTQLILPANSYLLNGNNYTGIVSASLNSLLTKGDFVRNLISNTGTNPLQETVAAFNLNLKTVAKETLEFKSQSKFNVNYADSNFPVVGYSYYFGTIANANQGGMIWNAADSSIGKLQNGPVTIQGNSKTAYIIESNKLGWLAINKNLNIANTANCNVILPINFTNKNTAVFVVLKNKNVVLRLAADANSKSFIGTKLPQGEEATFVALSYLDNKFYLGYTITSISNNAQYNIKTTTASISLASLNSFLDGL